MSRSRITNLVKAVCAACLLAALGGGQSFAAEPEQGADVIRIWPGQAPGTADWSGPENVTFIPLPGERKLRMISNVTTPTLTVFRPPVGKANGTGMIVIPGGGFQMLAVDHEGYDVARWLAERGVTAFVLKYRVRPIPGFQMPGDLRKNPAGFAEFARRFDSGRPAAVADATQAMRYLRGNAKALGIAPDRIGMIGFSAGAITTVGVILDAPATDRPNFAAPIYGAMIDERMPPAGAPPLFLAVTQDDSAVPVEQTLNIFNRWTAAGFSAEVHVYEKGGHGFGMRKLDAPVDHWTDALEAWMASHGWLGEAKNAKP